MKTNDLSDPRLARQVLGRPRFKRHIVTGVSYRESVEYRILQKKREIGAIPVVTPKYQLFFLGEWQSISSERYFELVKVNKNLPAEKQFQLRLL